MQSLLKNLVISTLVLTMAFKGLTKVHTYMVVIHMQMLEVQVLLDSLRDWRVCLLI